jgi:molybdopterin converting factor small subunit
MVPVIVEGEMQTNDVGRVLESLAGYGDRRGLVLTGLSPGPEEEWQRMRTFVGLGERDIEAMLETVEPLFRRGHELVVGNYDYLLKNHETAAILGWERGVDPEHLEERRRFFTVWLARTLGIDLSEDFARYLFKAGQKHAGHGPRRINVPDVYVTGAISLVNETFARFLSEEMPGALVVPSALSGWNKYLSMHLHMMLIGYQSAVELDQGEIALSVSLFGRIRTLLGCSQFSVHLHQGAQVRDALHKMLNYYPEAREEMFDIEWLQGERLDSTNTPWMTLEKAYVLKPAGWRVHVNGRGIEFSEGLDVGLSPSDVISIFPPTR